MNTETSQGASPVMELLGVSKQFLGITAVRDVSLAIRSAEVTCLLGDNGAGKSTLIKIMSGVHRPSAGEIRVDGSPVILSSPRTAQALGIGTVHQDDGALPLMSVARDFFLGREPVKGRGLARRIDSKQANQIALEQLTALGITRVTRGDQPVGTLSGGERQALAISRALYFGARLLILDEPTSSLGVREAGVVLRLIQQARGRGVAVVFITHNAHHAMTVGDRFTVRRSRDRSPTSSGRGERTREQLLGLMAGGGELESLQESLEEFDQAAADSGRAQPPGAATGAQSRALASAAHAPARSASTARCGFPAARLAAWRPPYSHQDGPFPALVTVVPYRKDGAAGVFYGPILRWFAERGYAGLLVDFLGTGSSDGSQRPPFDPGEADDGVAAVEWAARQTWSSGKVGMWGHSYGAIMSMRTAARHPPHLAAIAQVMGALDPERDFVHPSGARGCLGSVASWGLQTLASQLLPPLSGDSTAAEQARWQRRARDAEPWLLDLIRHGPGDPVWRSRAIDATAITVPSYCIAGWRDLFCDAHPRVRADRCPEEAAGRPCGCIPCPRPRNRSRSTSARWRCAGGTSGCAAPTTAWPASRRSPSTSRARPGPGITSSTWPPSPAELRYATASDTALTAQKACPGAPRAGCPAAASGPGCPGHSAAAAGSDCRQPRRPLEHAQRRVRLPARPARRRPACHQLHLRAARTRHRNRGAPGRRRPAQRARARPPRLPGRATRRTLDGRFLILISAGRLAPDAGALHRSGSAHRLPGSGPARAPAVLGDADFPGSGRLQPRAACSPWRASSCRCPC